MSRAATAGRIAARVSLSLLGVLLLLIVVIATAAWWLLFTPAGARYALAKAPGFIGAKLEVKTLSGALSGPLDITGLIYEDEAVRVTVGHASFDWQPSLLRTQRAQVDELLVEQIDVQLKPPRAPKAQKPKSGALTHLPVNLFLGKVSIKNFRLLQPDGGVALAIPRAELIGDWEGDEIHIRQLSGEYAPFGAISAQAEARLLEDGVSFKQFKLSQPFVVEGKGTLSYEKSNDLQLSWRDLRWPLTGDPMVTSREGSATLKGPWSQLDYTVAAELGTKTKVQSQGRWNGQLDAQLQWTDLTWPLTAPDAPWQSAKGRATVQGSPEAYRFDLDATLLAQGQKGQVQAKGSGGRASVKLDRLWLSAGKGSLEAAGPVQWAPQLAGDLKGRLIKFDPGLFAPGWSGELNGNFQVAGELAKKGQEELEPALNFEAHLKDSQLRGKPLKLDAAGRYARKVLTLDHVDLASGGSRLQASGRASAPYDLKATVSSPDLADLWPGLAGKADLQASVQGELAAPHLIAKGEGTRLAFQGMAASKLELDADLDWSGPLRLDLTATELKAGTLIHTLKLEGRGQRGDHTLKLSANSTEGDVDLTLKGAYDEAARRWQGQLAEGKLAPRQLAPWTLAEPAPLKLQTDLAELGDACWSSPPGRVCLQGRWSPQSTEAGVKLTELAFAYFQALLPGEVKVEGSASGEANIKLANGAITDLRADLASSAGAVSLRDKRFGFAPIKLSMRQEAEQWIGELRLPLEAGGLEADVRAAASGEFAQRALAGEVRADFPDLAFLPALLPQIATSAGRLSGRYTLSGRIGAPGFAGRVELADGRFRLTQPGIELTEVGIVVAGDAAGTLQVKGGAKSGDGRVDLTGLVSPGPKVQLSLKGDNFQAVNLPEARAWVSPDLQFQLEGKVASLKGKVDIPRAEITLSDRDSGVSASSDQILLDAEGKPPERQEALKIATEVRLTLGKDVRLQGYGLKTRITGGITAIDQPGRETIGHGELQLVEGQYKAYGQDLTIETGRVLFNGGPITKPGLEIKAVRRPTDDVQVGVQIRGTPEKPQLTLYSEPSMTQQEQLSWLLLGRPLQQANSSEDRGRVASAAMALGVGGGNYLAQGLGKGLGLDEISIGSKPGESTDQALFTVGKYLSPKLFVSYGFGIFQQAQVFRLLYDLGRGFKLSTESGTATGGDVLYTIER